MTDSAPTRELARRVAMHLSTLDEALGSEDLGRAAAALDALDVVHPAAGRLGRAQVAAEREDWPAVLRLLGELKGAPAVLQSRVIALICAALAETGRADQGEELAQSHLANTGAQVADPDATAVAVSLARCWLRSRRLEQAQLLLLQVLETRPQHAEALSLLGLAHLQRGELERALAVLRRACSARPGSARALLSLSQAWLLAGRPAEGARDIAARAGALGDRLEPGVLLALATLQLQAGLTGPVPRVLRRIESGGELGHGLRISVARLWAELGESSEIRRLAEGCGSAGVQALLEALADDSDGEDPLPALDLAAARIPEAWLVHERRAAALVARGELAAAEAAIAEARRRGAGKGEVRVTGAVIALTAARLDGDASGIGPALETLRMAADHPALLRSLRTRAHAALLAHEGALADS